MRTRSSCDVARLGVQRASRPANRLAQGFSVGSIGLVMLMAAPAASAATITVDASNSPRGNPKFWAEMVGTGTASLGLRADLQTHFKIANRELGMKRVRGHGILNDDMDIYQGPGNYNWTNFDTVLQGIAAAGMRPGMELSFMPAALARSGDSKDPPGDFGAYSDFIQAVVQRAIDLFGADDVSQWYWEVWNEPNYQGFWTGTMQDYYEMYDAAVAGATAALPNILIGGPVTTQGSVSQMTEFLQHCQNNGTRVSFLASHAYPGGSGPSANATFGRNDNDDRVNVITNAGYSLSEMPSLNTEWNTAYTGQGGNIADNTVSMDTHANAPFILKSVKLLADQVQGDTPPIAAFSYWVISDIFDESSGPSGSYILGQGGNLPFGQVFGLMTFQGVRKAAFNAFKMLDYLGPDQLSVSGGSGDSDGVDGMATISASSDEVAVIVYNYYSTINTTGSESVTLNVDNLPFAGQDIFVTKFGIDPDHSNPYGVWEDQGSPTNPSEDQWRAMRAEQHLELLEPVTTTTATNSYSTTFDLPHQGAALVILSLDRPLTGRDALVEMEGEDYDGQSGASKEDSDDDSMGQSISAGSGSYIYYNNVDFSDAGVDTVQLRVNAQSATTLELRADSESGTLLGTCNIAATGGSWDTQTCTLTPTTGVHTLYATFGGSMRLNWMQFELEGSVVGTGGAGGAGSGGSAGSAGAAGTPAGVGGTPTTGGSAGAGTGGAATGVGGNTATGGAVSTLGGAPGVGGGVATLGGAPGSGGAPGVGGGVSTLGGASGVGGAPGAGGLSATGGAPPAGVGGTTAIGGASSTPTCQPPLQQCGTACVDITSDAMNCGNCGVVCPSGQVCSSGTCVGVCAEGLTQCGQDCVDLNTSLVSCGSCGFACEPGQICESGVCVADPNAEAASKSGDEGGCGCRVGSERDAGSRGLLASLLAFGLLVVRRRRNRGPFAPRFSRHR